MINYLGGAENAGGKLKETGTLHWITHNIEATNESGFTALSGSSRNYDGSFGDLRYWGYWWTSTENDSNNAWFQK